MARLIEGKPLIDFTADTSIGALANYVATPNSNFVPMNANFCLVNEFFGYVKKKDRKEMYAQRSLEFIDKLLGDING
jgi:methylenetetrahydrofolate--tRNA-(uracil-5-)-methyltransferase